jgi:hypothetical protein
MSDSKISLLPAAAALTLQEQIALVQGGNSVVATLLTFLLALVSKVFVNNNAATTYVVAPTSREHYVFFTGTNAASIAFTFPTAAASVDGQKIGIFSVAAVGTATWASTGATFLAQPANLAANTMNRFIFDAPSNQWLRW